MDPAQLKAAYDQTQFLTQEIRKVDDNLLKSQYGQTQDILATQDRAFLANENRQNRNTQFTLDAIQNVGAQGLAATERTGKDAVLATERSAAVIDNNIYRTTGDINTNLYRSAAATDLNVYRTAAATDLNVSKVGENVHANVTESARQIQSDLASIRMDGNAHTNELIGYFRNHSDNNWRNFIEASKETLQGFSSAQLQSAAQFAGLSKQMSESTNLIQIEALKNKGDLSKQMAFEYSSLKDKIGDSEASIKELLRTQEADRLRDQIRATEHKSLYFELRGHHHGHHGHGHH